MCEFLERAGLRGTPTEEVREWSAMTHRVVELSGPFPTPDDMRVELWLHEESATGLLDMCDRIDAEFDRTKTENAKLRELVRRYGEYTSQDRCEGCVCKARCNDGYVDECWQLTEIRGLARELGVEVEQ